MHLIYFVQTKNKTVMQELSNLNMQQKIRSITIKLPSKQFPYINYLSNVNDNVNYIITVWRTVLYY